MPGRMHCNTMDWVSVQPWVSGVWSCGGAGRCEESVGNNNAANFGWIFTVCKALSYPQQILLPLTRISRGSYYYYYIWDIWHMRNIELPCLNDFPMAKFQGGCRTHIIWLQPHALNCSLFQLFVLAFKHLNVWSICLITWLNISSPYVCLILFLKEKKSSH